VRHSNGAPGVIYVRNLRWTHVEDASKLYKPGDDVRAEIIKFDDDKRQVDLSIKALLPNPFEQFMSERQLNETVSGVVTKLIPVRGFVDLDGGVKGSIHIRAVTGYALPTFDGHLHEGERYDFRIVGFDVERKQVTLARYGLVGPSRPTVTAAPARPRVPDRPVVPTRVAAPRPAAPTPKPVARAASTPAQPRRTPRAATAPGDSVDEAVRKAAAQLGLPASRLKVEVLTEPKKGFLGRTKQQARVRVTEKL
jgi:predicted RNA-binding protein with RPS1 domain